MGPRPATLERGVEWRRPDGEAGNRPGQNNRWPVSAAGMEDAGVGRHGGGGDVGDWWAAQASVRSTVEGRML